MRQDGDAVAETLRLSSRHDTQREQKDEPASIGQHRFLL
jgi:hypothetical protein